jgi:hypothetical protein
VALKSLKFGQRVHVARDADARSVNCDGTVVRLRRSDSGAWVKLDERKDGVYFPFPADDDGERGCHILAYPEDCRTVRLRAVKATA